MSDYISDIHKELYEGSEAGDCARVRELLEAGANPNKYKKDLGYTALHLAAWMGHNQIVTLLIHHPLSDVNVSDKYGGTALYYAAGSGYRDVVISLMDAGADPLIRCYHGKTPLEVAKNDDIARLEFI